MGYEGTILPGAEGPQTGVGRRIQALTILQQNGNIECLYLQPYNLIDKYENDLFVLTVCTRAYHRLF